MTFENKLIVGGFLIWSYIAYIKSGMTFLELLHGIWNVILACATLIGVVAGLLLMAYCLGHIFDGFYIPVHIVSEVSK